MFLDIILISITKILISFPINVCKLHVNIEQLSRKLATQITELKKRSGNTLLEWSTAHFTSHRKTRNPSCLTSLHQSPGRPPDGTEPCYNMHLPQTCAWEAEMLIFLLALTSIGTVPDQRWPNLSPARWSHLFYNFLKSTKPEEDNQNNDNKDFFIKWHLI